MDILTCVYCGHVFHEGTPSHGAQVLTDHIKVCEKHPMRAAETTIRKMRAALVGLLGVDGRTNLQEMELIISSGRATARDKALAIDAIHVLLETLPEEKSEHGIGSAGSEHD